MPTKCKYCGTDTNNDGTKLCDRCWELERRIEQSPSLARLILSKVDEDMPERIPVTPPIVGLTAVVRVWVNKKGNRVIQHDTIMTEDSPKLDAVIKKSGRKFVKAVKQFESEAMKYTDRQVQGFKRQVESDDAKAVIESGLERKRQSEHLSDDNFSDSL